MFDFLFSKKNRNFIGFLKYCIYFTILGDTLLNVIALQNFVLLSFAFVYAGFLKKRFAKFIFLHKQFFAQFGILFEKIRKFFASLGGG
jgi:hypothetical protein